MILRLNRYARTILLIAFASIPAFLPGQGFQMHTVRKGDTLFALSRQYGVSVDQIKEINNLQNTNLSIGQKLKIKPIESGQSTPPTRVSSNQPTIVRQEATTAQQSAVTGNQAPRVINLPEDYYYTVKPKDNLYRISLANNAKLAEILEWNGFVDENQLIRQGDRIIVKDPKSYQPIANPPSDSNPLPEISSAPADSVLIQRVYIVQRKDTLFRIATDNGMTVEELKRINNLRSNEIFVGQKLNLITPKGFVSSEQVTQGLTDEDIRVKDKIRTDVLMPIDGKVISEYGIRNGRPHKGIDIGAKPGSPIVAVLDGTVVFSGYQGAYGNVIVLEHPEFVMTVYAHNEKNLVSVGDSVTKGQSIATVGSTGNATAPHVHFEYRIKGKAINPRKVLPFE